MSGHGESSGGGHGGGGGHKKKHHHHGSHPEHEHEEGWIVGFADNVLLQMGFFVILLAMNMGPKGGGAEGPAQGEAAANTRMLDFAIAVREAFNSPVDLDSTSPDDQPLIRRLRERLNQGDTTSPGVDGNNRQVQSVRPNDWTGKDAYVDFKDSSAELSEVARTIIKQASEQIAGTYWMVEIRGHSSTLESFRNVEKSRKISYDRAWAVAQELSQHGVRWEQMLIVAAGDIAPVRAMASTARDHEANQRAEILITRTTMPSDPYSGGASGASGSGEKK
jgi:flagellar motor protein MotB